MGNIEYWQFFQSGQFVHHLACREDYDALSYQTSRPSAGPILDFVWTLFTCTEIFEFAARLASNEVFGPSAEVSVRLVGMNGRVLTSTNPARRLSMAYTCAIDEIEFNRSIATADLLARPAELALDCTQHIYERFGWLGSSREMLAEDQRKLLERAL